MMLIMIIKIVVLLHAWNVYQLWTVPLHIYQVLIQAEKFHEGIWVHERRAPCVYVFGQQMAFGVSTWLHKLTTVHAGIGFSETIQVVGLLCSL